MVDAFTVPNIGTPLDILSALLPFFFVLLFILGIAGTAFIAWWSGMLEPTPYKVMIGVARANGAREIKHAKGRFLKKEGGSPGQFEIRFGAMEKVRVQAPDENYIQYGNLICFRRDKLDDYVPCNMNWESGAGATFAPDPAMSPAAKLAFSTTVKEVALRFTRPNWLKDFAPHIAIIIAAIILGVSFLFGAGIAGKSYGDAAVPMNAIAAKLNNATVLVQYPQTPNNPNTLPQIPGVTKPPG